jgi:hypothetical protein
MTTRLAPFRTKNTLSKPFSVVTRNFFAKSSSSTGNFQPSQKRYFFDIIRATHYIFAAFKGHPKKYALWWVVIAKNFDNFGVSSYSGVVSLTHLILYVFTRNRSE